MITLIDCGPVASTDPACGGCGHPLWAPASRERGYCEACRLADAKPQCTKTDEECFQQWRSWRDDCQVHRVFKCDVDQCLRGHPDDGVTSCGACGHGLNWPGARGKTPCPTCGLPTWLDPGAEVATCTNPNCQ